MVPQCRTAVKTGGLRKIYLTDTEDSGGGNQEDLLSELDSAKLQLRLKETERATAVNRNQELEAQSQKQKEELQKMEVAGKKMRQQYEGLRSQKMLLQGERARAEELILETKQLRNKLENLKGVELALRGQEGDLNQFLHERGAFDARTKDLANLVILLKKKLIAVKVERSKAESQLKSMESHQGSEKAKVMALETQVADLQAVARNLARDLEKSKEENLAFEERLKGGSLLCDGNSSWREEDIEEELLSGNEDEKDETPQLSSRGILPQMPRQLSEVSQFSFQNLSFSICSD